MATKFCEIFPLILTTVHTVKSKGIISQNFVAFSEYMNFTTCFTRFTEVFDSILLIENIKSSFTHFATNEKNKKNKVCFSFQTIDRIAI